MKETARTPCLWLWRLYEEFSKQTTVHGLNIVGMPKLHILERLFWVVIVVSAACGAISLALSNWTRYSANPTVVSLQKDFRNWENPFPAATGCFNNKLDDEKAEAYIKKKWGVTPSDSNYTYYLEFTRTITNTTYYSLQALQAYKDDKTLTDVNMVELVAKVHPELSGTLVTFHTKHKTDWQLILTELGVCFTVNSKFAEIISLRAYSDNPEATGGYVEALRCHYLNGLCYARYDSDPTLSLKYYLHSYLDIVHITARSYHDVEESEEMEINYRMIETISTPDLRYLSPTQRRCRFDDEPLTGEVSFYSTSICYVLCRYKLALKLCGCKPFFYHFLPGKVCDINGLLCLSKHVDKITDNPARIGCKCPQPCDLIVYLPQMIKCTKWEYGYFDQRITFRWGLLPPTTKYRRDILFGFEDLIVSIGGTVALFLGISFISVIEMVFLIFENAIKLYMERKDENTKIFVVKSAGSSAATP
ncbi:hypothetical protein NQ315_016906 [Exocentrus adspersus]|uniref:Sodium channel protein Nach n=1 Tax=Exocentrus adspersus TaxID=1586481 RepID=A0AAV8VY57_9CUCU|nr:hypothetical protein NQ315_016906 [Exocentrus adspersus]